MKQFSDEEFYKWLLDKENINLNYFYDYSIFSGDPKIAYPDEFKAFFESTPMKRLSRILQLSRIINFEPDVFHTRFEHSIGVFKKKMDLIKTQLQNDKWRSFIETANLKPYLVAELIKSAGHDIGHLPLSHVLETTFLRKHGYHENIGMRILTENKEINQALASINPEVPDALKYILNHDLFGFGLLDSGNYDIDRLDYLNRDALYSHSAFHTELEPSTIIEIDLDREGQIKYNPDGSIQTGKSMFSRPVCVFEEDSIPSIENFLLHRVSAYENLYVSPRAQVFDTSISVFMELVARTPEARFSNLYQFLLTLCPNYRDVDLDKYIQWDDVRFYNELINLIKSSKNSSFQVLGASILPRLYSLLNMAHSLLSASIDYSKPGYGLSDIDREFITNLNSIITGTDESDIKMRKATTQHMPFYIETNLDRISKLHSDPQSAKGTFFSKKKIVAYKTNEPIFVKDSIGRIFTLDSHPKSDIDWPSHDREVSVAFTLTPYLNLLGYSQEEQQELISQFTDTTMAETLDYNAPTRYTNANAGIFGLAYTNIDNTER